MLPVIDARALFVASSMIFACLLVSVVLAWRELGRMRGPDRLALAYTAFFLGLVLFSLRGHVPALLSIAVANTLFVLGAGLVLEAIRLFYGLSPVRRLIAWTTGGALAAFLFLTLARDEPAFRTILSSAFLASLLGATSWTIWHRRPRGGTQVLEKVTSLALGVCRLLADRRVRLEPSAPRRAGALQPRPLRGGRRRARRRAGGGLRAPRQGARRLGRPQQAVALIPNVATDARWHHLPSQGLILRSALSAPIENGLDLLGVLTLVHPDPEHFGEDQQHLIESTTAQVALAIRTAQLDDARQQATGEQELVRAVLEVSARGAEAEQIVADAAEAIALRARSPRAYLALAGEDGHFRLAGRTDGLAVLRPRLDERLLGRAFERGAPRQDEISAAGEGFSGEGPAWTRLVAPVQNLGRTLGLACFERPCSTPFDREDVALADALAEAVGLGLGKAALARTREEPTRMMVHDLRGPISGVMGELELLGGASGLDETALRLVEAAQRNTRRQLKLVEGILEIARLEEGALPVRQEDVELSPIVEEAVRTMRPAAEARHLELAWEAPGDLPVVRADPGLVVRVLENLVGNAVKFSPPGSGAIRVLARRDGTAVEAFVRDCGPGVEEKVRARVFEKFTVGNQPGRGSGLGLAFCRLAVEAQGGRIWLEHPGPGAVFAFSIPSADAPTS